MQSSKKLADPKNDWTFLRQTVRQKQFGDIRAISLDSVVQLKLKSKQRDDEDGFIDGDELSEDDEFEFRSVGDINIGNFNLRKHIDTTDEIIWVSPPPSPRHISGPLQLTCFLTESLVAHEYEITIITENLNFMVSCSRKEVFVWWKQRWVLAHRLVNARVYSATMSNRFLFLRGADEQVTIWNPAIGRRLFQQRVNGARAPMAITDKEMLITAHPDDILEVFRTDDDCLTWVCIMENNHHKGKIEALSASGKFCVTGVEDLGFFLWCADIGYERFGQCVARFDCPGRSKAPCSVAITANRDGVFIGTTYDGTVLVGPEHNEPNIFQNASAMTIGKPYTFQVLHDCEFGFAGASVATIGRDGQFAAIAFDGMGVLTLDVVHGRLLHMIKDAELPTGPCAMYARKGTQEGYQVICATRSNRLSVWTIEAVSRMRITILMSFHERAGESSLIQTAWIQQGSPLYTPQTGRFLMGVIFELGMPRIANDEIQQVFGDNYNMTPPSKNQPYDVLQVDDRLSKSSKKLPTPNRRLPKEVHSLRDAKDSATSWMKQ